MLLKDFVSPVRRRRRNRLDRFGRVVDHRWINASNVDVDRYRYGYDRNSNRTYKENGVIASLSEVYTNDDLNQLASYKLGTLNGGKTDVTGTPTNAQTWDYDAVGNWDSVTTNSTTQTRGANRQNEITSVSSATAPTYDNNGNLTKDENDTRFVWDAWNMLVQVKNSSNVVIVTYGRDALHRHVTDTVGASVTDRFFSTDWQVLETKVGSNTITRNVWSPAYVDALVLRDRDTDSNGTLDERLYSLQDANWNTTALVNTSGSVVERDTYTPFGVVTFRDASGAIISSSAKDWVFLHQGGEKIAAGDYEFRNRVYSPNLGRWLSNDPIGFAAGDVNISRYVGNAPGNGLDPLGLETPVPSRIYNPQTSKTSPRIPETNGEKGKAFENVKLPFLNQALTYFFDTSNYNKLKDAITDGNVIDPVIDKVKNTDKNGVMGGTHAFFNGYPKMGSHFGTGGADPCVGVIIICNDNGKIYEGIFHFYAGEDGVSTISQYEWKGIKTAYIFGGNNKANLSFYLYRDLYRFLKKETNGNTWAYEGSNAYINPSGKFATSK